MGLYDILSAAGQGLSSGLQAHDALQQRERQQRIEDEEREERKRLRALEAALMEIEAQQRKDQRPTFDVGPGGTRVSGIRDPAKAAAYSEKFEQPEQDVNWQTVQTGQGYVQVHPRTGETRPVRSGAGEQLAPPPDEPEPEIAMAPGEARTRILAGLPRMEQGLRQIEEFLGASDTGRVPVERFLGSQTLGRYLQGEDLQAYQAAANRLVGSILRVESGAAIRPEEVRELAQQMVPQPEDKPAVVQQKLEVLRATVARMRQLAGLPDANDLGDPTRPATPGDLSQLSDEEFLRFLQQGPARGPGTP